MAETNPIPASVVPFGIVGFPCSGMDWFARLVSLHPNIVVVDAVDSLGPIGGQGWNENRQLPPVGDLAGRVRAAMAQKPAATHVGIVGIEGALKDQQGEYIAVLRDGRDVLVHWTLRQLRERGPVLARFLAEPGDGRMPEVARRFAADPDDVLTKNPWLLLCDYDWVRYGTKLWEEPVTGHRGMLGWSNDHPADERDPCTAKFDEARTEPRSEFDRLVRWLGLDPEIVPPFAEPDPVFAAETDAVRKAEWEVGIWRRFFTKRAGKLFKMDGWRGIESIAGYSLLEDWDGDCASAPV